MKNIEFSTNIKNGIIKVPRRYKNLENTKVKVVFEPVKSKRAGSKLSQTFLIKSALNKILKRDVFSDIKDAVKWQKKLRDEW